ACWEAIMDSFEARLVSALTLTEQLSDEAFVQRVNRSIAASEEKRRIGLAMATLIVVCLAVVVCYGMARTWSVVGSIASPLPQLLALAVPLLVVFIIVFAAVLLLAFEADGTEVTS